MYTIIKKEKVLRNIKAYVWKYFCGTVRGFANIRSIY